VQEKEDGAGQDELEQDFGLPEGLGGGWA